MITLLVSTTIAIVLAQDPVSLGQTWVDAKVPYCQAANHQHDSDSSCASTCTRPDMPQWDAYRSDCSGFVSYCWGLPAPGLDTSAFAAQYPAIDGNSLSPGDALVVGGSHIIMFVSWQTMGQSANFMEEPGCSSSEPYARAFSSDVQISGNQVNVAAEGKTFTAIKCPSSSGSSSQASSSGSMMGSSSGFGSMMSSMMGGVSSMMGGLMSSMGGLFSGMSSSGGGFLSGLFGGSGSMSSAQAGSSGSSGGGVFSGLFGGAFGQPNSQSSSGASSGSGGGLFSGFFGGGGSSSAYTGGLFSGLFGSQNDVVFVNATPTWPTEGACTGGVVGICQDIKYPCLHSYRSFACGANADANVRCCPIASSAIDKPLVPGIVPNTVCQGLSFPVAPGSLQHISVNYGGMRDNGARCHTGIDLFTLGAKKAIAVTDGVVLSVITGYAVCSCTGEYVTSSAVLIYHTEIGLTYNYGELTNVQVKPGDTVTQGQFLGTADACCMLHLEIWMGRKAKPDLWLPAAGVKSVDPDGCTTSSMSTRPATLIDPRPFVNCSKPVGSSLLQDAGVSGEQLGPPVLAVQTTPAPTTKMSISGGVIAAIVIVGLIVLMAIAICVVCFVRHRQRGERADINMANPAFQKSP